MNRIMTFLLFFSPEKMIYSHHLMYAWIGQNRALYINIHSKINANICKQKKYRYKLNIILLFSIGIREEEKKLKEIFNHVF